MSTPWNKDDRWSFRRRFGPKRYHSRCRDHLAKADGELTDTTGWTESAIHQRIEEVKKSLDWERTIGIARKWWEAFELENSQRPDLILRVVEELLVRKATITEFYLTWVLSNVNNIQANLHYLDYRRLKKKEDQDPLGRGGS
jgi:hypothetical protein